MIKAHEIQGVHRAGEQLQPRRPRPRRAGEGRLHRGRRADARAARATRSSTRCRSPGSTASRCAPTATRRTPARARAGRRATRPPRRAPRADREDRRDGLPVGADREDLGLLRRAVQGQAVQVPAPVRQLRDGERAVQDHLPGRVPRADRGRMRDAAASAGQGPARRHREDHDPHARVGDPHHRQEGPARTIRPTATTASSTWSPCR